MSDHRPDTGGGLGTVAAGREPVTERRTLSPPARRRRTSDVTVRPARRVAVTAASFAIFSTAAFGVVAVTAPEVIGYAPTAGSAVSNGGPAATRPGPIGAGAQPADARTAEATGSADADARDATDAQVPRDPGGNGTASASPPVTTTGPGPDGQVPAERSTHPQRPGRDPATTGSHRGPVGAYLSTPTGGDRTPTTSGRLPGPHRPGPGTGSGSAEPTRPTTPTRSGTPTSEADGG